MPTNVLFTTLIKASVLKALFVFEIYYLPFPCMMPCVKYRGARPEKVSFAKASLINLWSDSTTAYILPILIPYIGPYCLANAVNVKCGWWRLRKGKYPTMGRPHGPGGKFCHSFCFLKIQKPRTRLMSHKKMKSILIWNNKFQSLKSRDA